jgi:RNA polymerase primary sigma factor
MPLSASPYTENESLCLRLQAGDRHAAEALLTLNRRLLCKTASAFLSRSGTLEFDDLLQEGSLGLLHAASRFDPERGCRFSTYATPWIRQHIARAIHGQAWTIRRPVHVSERASRAAATGTDQEWLAALPNACVSLDAPMGEDGGTTLADLLPDTSDPEGEATGSLWATALLDTLPPRERHVIAARCGFPDGEPQTLQMIADRFHVTREWVRQIEVKALTRLRSLAE